MIKKDGRLLVLLQISKDIYVTYYIESSNSLFGPVYSSLNLADTIDVKVLGDNVFSCNNGTLTELHIEKVKTFNSERLIPTMDKFINEEFDSSITDDHNAYSAEAESVEYIFTLIPPIIDNSFVESNIYDEIHSLEKELVLVNKLNVEKIDESYHSFLEEDYGILSFLEKGNELTNGISGSVKKCDYHGYYRVLNHYCELYENFNFTLEIQVSMILLIFPRI